MRQLAAVVQQVHRPDEPLAMVGINKKPSLHYYSRLVVLYVGRPASGLIDLAEQLPPHWHGVAGD